jgi:uncharacterized protein (TIGR02147 family)
MGRETLVRKWWKPFVGISVLILLHALVRLGRLNISPVEKCEALESIQSLSPAPPKTILDASTFLAISKWYYYVIRQLGCVENAQVDASWLKNQLRFFVPENELQRALNVLVDLGLIEIQSRDKFVKTSEDLESTTDVSSEAIKRYHEQTLELAKRALREIPIHERHFGALTFAIDSSLIGRARELVASFKEDMRKLAGRSEHPDAVYQFQVQLYPMTKTKRRNSDA